VPIFKFYLICRILIDKYLIFLFSNDNSLIFKNNLDSEFQIKN